MFKSQIEAEEFMNVLKLENDGRIEEAKNLLLDLVNQTNPLAVIELGSRYLMQPEDEPTRFMPGFDEVKSKELLDAGVTALRKQAQEGDAEAMRHFALLKCGLIGPYPVENEEAEKWLLKAFEAGCHFAANDLYEFYLLSDKEKSKYWYKQAEKYNCRVVYNEDFET